MSNAGPRSVASPSRARNHNSRPPNRGAHVHGGQDSVTSLDLLTVPEVMARMRVGRHKVYDLIRSRELRSIKVGNSRRIPVTALAEYMAQRMEEDD